MQIRIDDSDLKEINKIAHNIISQSPQKLDEILKNTATHIQGEAKRKAPVGKYPKGSNRTGGFLRRNIIKGKDGDGYFVKSNANYSLYVEYGNRWWSGVSFLRPAIESGMVYLGKEAKKSYKW